MHVPTNTAALAINKNVNVITCDICDEIPDKHVSIKNVENIIVCSTNIVPSPKTMNKMNLILIDLHPHNERKILNKLIKYRYKSIVILGNININDNMRSLWESIVMEKNLISSKAHWAGTGILMFI